MSYKKEPPSGYCEKNPAWSNAKYWSFVRSNIRLMQRKWGPLQDIWKERRPKPADVPGRHKFEYQCEECSEWFARKHMQADHTTPCGTLLAHEDIGSFVDRMLSPKGTFRRMCKPCHQIKTNEERNEKSKN